MRFLLAIPFVNPLFAWSVAGLALIPLIIHILNRRRHREVPWAAMMFLLAANRKSIRRTRLEQILLLVLRTLILALLGFALARPYFQAGAALAGLGRGTQHVIVLDDSLSMSAHSSDSGHTVFDTQIARVLQMVQQLPAGDAVTLIAMGYPARALNRKPTFDKALAGRLVRAAELRDTRTDLAGALELLTKSVNQEGQLAELSVTIVSDFTRAVLRSGDPEGSQKIRNLLREISKQGPLSLLQVRGPASNLAVEELQLGNYLVGVRTPTEILSRVQNYSSRRSEACRIRLSLNGTFIREDPVPALEPGESTTLQSSVEFSAAGFHSLERTLIAEDGNALAADDLRRLVVQVRRQIPVFIVDGKPGLTSIEGQAGYLATAMSPRISPTEERLVDPKIISEAELNQQNLSAYDIIVLCNVRRLTEDNWARLDRRVRDGGGLLIYFGDLIDVEHYNSWGESLLPASLIGPAYIDPNKDQIIKLDPGSVEPPLAADFKGREQSGLFLAHTHQYIRLATAEGQGRVLLRYANGDPAIVTRRHDAGRCAVVTTSANMDWTNLPAKGDFVTLTMNLLRHVAPDNASGHNITAGQRYRRTGDGKVIDAGEHYLVKPDQSEVPLSAASDGTGEELSSEIIERAGWYTLREPDGESPLAVNVDPCESDLTHFSEEQLQLELAVDFDYAVVEPAKEQEARVSRSEATSAILYLVLMMLLAETLMAMWFGHRKA